MKVEGHANPEVLISVSNATATEGPGVTMDFVVSLSRATSGTVTADYLTLDGTALAFHDYQYRDGTLTFQPGETSKTVSVPIVDDAVNDSGETFQLLLVNVNGADIAGGGTGTGTIFNTDVLTGSFENVPEAHDGLTGSFEGVPEAHDGRNDLWEITVEPLGAENVTITLPRRDCGTTGAVCTREDTPRALTNSPSATVAGLSYKTLRDLAFSETNWEVTQARRKQQGSNQGWTVTVDPTGNGGVSITLPETTNCSNAVPSARMTDAS